MQELESIHRIIFLNSIFRRLCKLRLCIAIVPNVLFLARYRNNNDNVCSWSPQRESEQGGLAHLRGPGDAAELLQLGLLAPGHHHLVERGETNRSDRPAGESVIMYEA